MGQVSSVHFERHRQWNVCWQGIVKRPVMVESMRSRHTGHVGSSMRVSVDEDEDEDENMGLLGPEADGEMNGSVMRNGRRVSFLISLSESYLTDFTNMT